MPRPGILLDVGCGKNRKAGWVGLDRKPQPSVDIVHDIEELPWPLEDNTCAVILMSHLWEHIKPWLSIPVMDEMWRLLEPEGQLQITCPYGYSPGYLQDPTHCNPATELTWQYFDPAYELYKEYEPKPWRIIRCEHQVFGNMIAVMVPRKTKTASKRPESIVIPQRAASAGPQDIIDAYHELQYNSREHGSEPKWRGRLIDKCVYDLWRYQELILQVRPKVIIETGTANGTSALYFADMMALAGISPRVITVDIDDGIPGVDINPMRLNPGEQPKDSRIEYLIGDSVSFELASQIGERVLGAKLHPAMVVLDSCHSKQHVLKELEIYSPLVSKGSYLVVEDTNINGHPVYEHFGAGPYEAMLDWLPKHPEFEQHAAIERRFPFTHNPGGWLRRT